MSRRQCVVSEEKKAYEEKMNDLIDNNSKIFFVTVDNVRSQQIHHIRRDLRGKATLIMGKKTLQRKIVDNRAARSEASEFDKLFNEKTLASNLLRQNTGMIFTNEDASFVTDILSKHRIQAPARVGAISPCDVVISAGNTGMDPTMTSFFQALSIPTKITKGTVEIISDKKVLSVDDKVDNSVATLLQKLKISPFFYQMEVKGLWDRGVVFTKADLRVTDAELEEQLLAGIQNLSAASLGAGIPTSASIPVVAADAFRKLLAAAVATEYTFDDFGAAEIIKQAREGKLAAAPAAAAAAAPAAAKAEPEPEEDEDDDFGMGGLF